MALDLNNIVQTAVGERYIVKRDHRDGTAEKSQWIISIEAEIVIFEFGFNSKWLSVSTESIWSLNLNNKGLDILGLSQRSEPPQQNLRIAKFVKSLEPFFWHGYPANYRRKIQDRPEVPILKDWHRQGLIEKHDITKIRTGKKCNLSN